MSVSDDQFISLHDAARLMNISARSVLREIERCKLDGYKFGGQVRIRESDLEDYIERSRRGDYSTEPEPAVTRRRPRRRSRSKVATA